MSKEVQPQLLATNNLLIFSRLKQLSRSLTRLEMTNLTSESSVKWWTRNRKPRPKKVNQQRLQGEEVSPVEKCLSHLSNSNSQNGADHIIISILNTTGCLNKSNLSVSFLEKNNLIKIFKDRFYWNLFLENSGYHNGIVHWNIGFLLDTLY